MSDERVDLALVARGLVRSRSAAQAAVAAGRVRADGSVVKRVSQRVGDDAVLEVDRGSGWVGRGAGKLDAALDTFGVDVDGALALDLGASTGGFTQVLLERGARSVVALDVGHDELAPELREDPRVAAWASVVAASQIATATSDETGSPAGASYDSPAPKSSGETWSRNSLNFSTTSSVSSTSCSNSIADSAITSSAAKIGAPARTARAIASLGRESISISRP